MRNALQLAKSGRRAFQTKAQILSPVKLDAIEINSWLVRVIET